MNVGPTLGRNQEEGNSYTRAQANTSNESSDVFESLPVKTPLEKGRDLLVAEILRVSTGEEAPKISDENLNENLQRLSYREREIIKLRFGLLDGQFYSLEEVANLFKFGRERAAQLQLTALRKLASMR